MEDSENQNNTTQGGDDKVDSPFTAPDNSPVSANEAQPLAELQAEPQPSGVQPSFGGPQPPVGDSSSVQTPDAPFNSNVPSGAPIVGGPVMSSPQKSGGKGKKIAIIAISALMFLLLAGGVAAFFVVNHLNNKPEKVLADALVNTASDLLDRKPTSSISKVIYKSTEENITVTVDIKALQSGDDGQVDAVIKVESQDLNFDLNTSAAVFGAEEFYFKIDDLEKTANQLVDNLAQQSGISRAEMQQVMALVRPIMQKIDGSWVKVTTEDLNSVAGSDVMPSDTSKCTEALKALKISDKDKGSLKELFNNNQFIVATEVYDQKEAGGEKSFHYKIDGNEAAAKGFASGVKNLESFKRVIDDCESENQDTTPDESSSSDDDINPIVELWVGTETRRFTKIKVTGKNSEMEIDFSGELKFEQPSTKIEKPSDFITIEELQKDITDLMAELTGAGPAATSPAASSGPRSSLSL